MNPLQMAMRLVSSLPEAFDSALNRWVVDVVDPKPGEVVLDIGAGAGPAALVAAQRGATIKALEPSRLMRSGLRLRNAIANGPVEVIDSTVEELPLADESIDAAYAVNSLHHWEDRSAGFRQLVRVLKPSGRVYLIEEQFDRADHSMHDAMSRFMSSHMDLALDTETVEKELARAGFGSVEVRTATVDDDPVTIYLAQIV